MNENTTAIKKLSMLDVTLNMLFVCTWTRK